MRLIFLLLSLNLFGDDEIFVDQTGSNATIKLEQLGSNNIIGGTSAQSGQMTALDLDGSNMTLTINQIGSSNIFRSDGINSDFVTGFFDFQGDSNVLDILLNSNGANSVDYANLNVQVAGGSNTFDIEIGEVSNASYLDLDWIIDGDNNEFDFDIDYENATNYVDVFGDNNELTFTGSGYAGITSSDSAYFYLDLDGSSNTFSITQSSTLARDWLKITTNGSNNLFCIVQNDGGTSTTC